MDISKYPPGYLEEYCGNKLFVAAIAFIAINVAAFILRFTGRRLQETGFGWHDALICLAFVFNVGLCADAIVSLRWGLGYHQARLYYYENWKLKYFYTNTFYAALILYYFSVTLPKISVLVLYIRVFTTRVTKIASYILIGVCCAYIISGCFVIGFQCPQVLETNPDELPETQVARCINIKAYYAWFGIPNILTDLAIMLLPLPSIAKLHQPVHVRVGLAATFVIASGGMIVAIVRFVFFYRHQFTGREAFSDATWSAVRLAIITLLECTVYFVCACLLCARPVLSKIISSRPWERLVSWTYRSSRKSSENSNPKRDSLRKVKGRSGVPHIGSMAPVSKFEPDLGMSVVREEQVSDEKSSDLPREAEKLHLAPSRNSEYSETVMGSVQTYSLSGRNVDTSYSETVGDPGQSFLDLSKDDSSGASIFTPSSGGQSRNPR